jgi:hypothetical protein
MPDEQNPDQGVSAHANASANISAELSIWHWFSHDQALAATNLSRRCGELEAYSTRLSDEERAAGVTWAERYRPEHRAYAIASIVASESFLEASINELYASASHENLNVGGGQGGLSRDKRDALMDVADLISGNRILAG